MLRVCEKPIKTDRFQIFSLAFLAPPRGVYTGTDTGESKARKLAEKLESLEPGTYIHLDHAAEDTPEMRAIGHEGYRFVAQKRKSSCLDQ